MFNFRILHQGIEPARQFANAALAFFEHHIVLFTVGNGRAAARADFAPKPPGLIGDFLDDTAMRFGILVFFEQFQSRAAVRVIIFETKGFETSKIRYQN